MRVNKSTCLASTSGIVSTPDDAENFSMLTRNVEENGLQTVTCVNEAVASARGGRMPFLVHPTGAGEHRL
jgi:hypothetical protein